MRQIFNSLRFAGFFSLLFFLLFMLSAPANSQPVLGARNTALGSGGTAYLGGLEATFWNPANLMIKDRVGQWHIGTGHIGILYEPVLSSSEAGDQFFNFTESFYPYKPGTNAITTEQRQNIIADNYPRNSLRSQHQTRADLIMGGALWQRGDAAFSVVVRSRIASRIEVGRGWYSNTFIPSGNQQIRDFTLTQQRDQFYEFGVGYAREFTFINGLIPRISKLYVGITPKIVLPGPSMNAKYNAQYIRTEENKTTYVRDFSYHTTGEYSRLTNDYLISRDPSKAITDHLNRRFSLQTTGYGLGFDFGLTYLVPLGENLPILKESGDQSVVSNSLRLGFSINDIGMLRYNQNPVILSLQSDSTQISQQAPKETMFLGSEGQYLDYLHTSEGLPNPIINANNESSNAYSSLLPTSMNAGVMLELSQLKLMGDLTLGLNNTAFTTTKLTVNLGIEARPIPQIPVRIGTRLASGLPTHVGMGTGIETRHLDFSVGTQVILRSRTLTSELVGGAFTGIQLHF